MYRTIISGDFTDKEVRQFKAARNKGKLYKRIKAHELLSLIPDELLNGIVQSLKADKWTKKLSAQSFFKLLVFSIFDKDVLSLRTIADELRNPALQAYIGGKKLVEVSHMGIRHRMEHIDKDFFGRIFEHLYKKTSENYSEQVLEKEYAVKRYDSTMVPVFAHHLSGMRVGNTSKNKTQMKFTTEFCRDMLPKMLFFKDQAHLSEETALSEIVLAQTHGKNEICVIDAGLKSRETFARLVGEKIKFICRLSKNPKHKTVGAYKHKLTADTEELELIHDKIVKLYTSGATEPLDTTFRLIEYRIKKNGEILSLVTNVLELPAQTVAAYYRKRWDIEVFFRFVKQELDFEHFVSYDENAIMIQIYMKLIVAMLILIYKKQNTVKSYQTAKSQFFNELLFTLIADILQDEEATEWFKNIIYANFVSKNQ